MIKYVEYQLFIMCQELSTTGCCGDNFNVLGLGLISPLGVVVINYSILWLRDINEHELMIARRVGSIALA